jgi:hypothetical protein
MLRLRAGIVKSEEQVESDVEGRENRRERRAQATCEMPAETSDLQSPHRSSTSHWLLQMKKIKNDGVQHYCCCWLHFLPHAAGVAIILTLRKIDTGQRRGVTP